jgi:hypothetical protein
MESRNRQEDIINRNRRKFLTVILIGSGALLVEKFLTPFFTNFLNGQPIKTNLLDKTGSTGFQVVENKKGLSVYDNSGEEILQIDREA